MRHSILSVIGSTAGALAACGPVSGSFEIESFMLYPENSDWDSTHCKFYVGSIFNASVLVYDPYTKDQSIITFPGVTANSSFHISGIDFDVNSRQYMYFSANAATPFSTYDTAHHDLGGANFLIKYDTEAQSVSFSADMAPFVEEVQRITGVKVNGFQDMAEDLHGNSYFLACFGNAIAKVDASGNVSTFFVTPAAAVNTSSFGFSGVASLGNTLIVGDDVTHKFYKFDTIEANATQVPLPVAGLESISAITIDGMILPSRYNNTVLLCSDDYGFNGSGGIAVIVSLNGWTSATYVGEVRNDNQIATNSTPTATVQIADSIYISEEFLFDTGTFDVPGNRSVFPFIDITQQVDDLVSSFVLSNSSGGATSVPASPNGTFGAPFTGSASTVSASMAGIFGLNILLCLIVI